MNVIVCQTPLQVLIAERIIDLHPNENFFGIMVTYTPNEKYIFYYNRLKNKCTDARFFALKQPLGRVQFLTNLLKMYRHSFSVPKFDKLFLANIDSDYVFFLIAQSKKIIIKTFDDGTMNLKKDEAFREYSSSIKMKLLRKTLKIEHRLATILAQNTEHFSIYKGFDNIFPNPTFIDLFENNSTEKPHHTQRKSILLGQPIFNESEKNIQLFGKIINSFSIDYYLPHPRENYQIENIEYLKTPFILEDFLLNELKENPHILYEIYTISSSAALNIVNFPNVKIKAVITENLPEYILPIYDLYKKANINIINF